MYTHTLGSGGEKSNFPSPYTVRSRIIGTLDESQQKRQIIALLRCIVIFQHVENILLH